jgi:hypothetical protein
MDTIYNIDKGYLKLHMETYIVSIYDRFHSFDLSMGVPFRELVGCLMWVCLCIMGPELLRVKDLARLSNCYTEDDFQSALKVLDRVYARRTYGIVIVRGEQVLKLSRRPRVHPGLMFPQFTSRN